MSACSDFENLLHGLVDGELDAANTLRCEQHVAGCPGCQQALRDIKALSSALQEASLSYPASARLRVNIVAALRAPSSAARAGPWYHRYSIILRPMAWPAAAVAAAAALMLIFLVPTQQNDIVAEIVAGHVRSLQASHLVDVAASDRHVVKPWFAGHLDFSPPVYDLVSQGYPLAGGRVDYLAGHPVAAIVYRHGLHVINLFLWPTDAGGKGPGEWVTVREGFNVRHWRLLGMDCWAVSDMNAQELAQFESLLRAAMAT